MQRTISATVLHCDPIHAPNVTPGPATVTAYIERGTLDDNNLANDDDLVVKTTVTVVGPPAANGVTVTAAPASLACGEKATITVDHLYGHGAATFEVLERGRLSDHPPVRVSL